MKNFQVIDGAVNCAYTIYQLEDDEFLRIFPEGQDVEFIKDVIARLGQKDVNAILSKAWQRRIAKPDANGIHGTLFYQLDEKKRFYPNRKEADLRDGKLQIAIAQKTPKARLRKKRSTSDEGSSESCV